YAALSNFVQQICILRGIDGMAETSEARHAQRGSDIGRGKFSDMGSQTETGGSRTLGPAVDFAPIGFAVVGVRNNIDSCQPLGCQANRQQSLNPFCARRLAGADDRFGIESGVTLLGDMFGVAKQVQESWMKYRLHAK